MKKNPRRLQKLVVINYGFLNKHIRIQNTVKYKLAFYELIIKKFRKVQLYYRKKRYISVKHEEL